MPSSLAAWEREVERRGLDRHLGRTMIETRGFAWPLALHFVGDLVIYTFLALAATTPAGGYMSRDRHSASF